MWDCCITTKSETEKDVLSGKSTSNVFETILKFFSMRFSIISLMQLTSSCSLLRPVCMWLMKGSIFRDVHVSVVIPGRSFHSISLKCGLCGSKKGWRLGLIKTGFHREAVHLYHLQAPLLSPEWFLRQFYRTLLAPNSIVCKRSWTFLPKATSVQNAGKVSVRLITLRFSFRRDLLASKQFWRSLVSQCPFYPDIWPLVWAGKCLDQN